MASDVTGLVVAILLCALVWLLTKGWNFFRVSRISKDADTGATIVAWVWTTPVVMTSLEGRQPYSKTGLI